MRTHKEGQARVLTTDEIDMIFKTAEKKGDIRLAAILGLSFFVGLRVSEIAGLKYSDVFNTKGEVKDEAVLRKEITKGNKTRSMFLTNERLRIILKEYISVYFKHGDVMLFTSSTGRKVSANSMQYMLHKFYHKIGLVGASSHSGRRTYATRAIDKGVNIAVLSRLLGHSDISTTMRYVQTNPVQLADINRNFNY